MCLESKCSFSSRIIDCACAIIVALLVKNLGVPSTIELGWRYVYTPFDYIDTLYNTNQAREYYVDTLCYCIDTLSG